MTCRGERLTKNAANMRESEDFGGSGIVSDRDVFESGAVAGGQCDSRHTQLVTLFFFEESPDGIR